MNYDGIDNMTDTQKIDDAMKARCIRSLRNFNLAKMEIVVQLTNCSKDEATIALSIMDGDIEAACKKIRFGN